MKIIILTLLVLLTVCSHCFSQSNTDSLITELKRLNVIKQSWNDSIKSIDAKIKNLNYELNTFQKVERSQNLEYITVKITANLLIEPHPTSESIKKLQVNTKLKILEVGKTDFIFVSDGETTGYIHSVMVGETSELRELIKKNYEGDVALRKSIQDSIRSFTKSPRWVASDIANVRSQANTSSEIINTLERGTILYFKYSQGEWSYVFQYTKDSKVDEIDSLDEISNLFDYGWIYNSLLSESEILPMSIAERRRNNFITNNPNLSSTYKNDILTGKIRIGMNDKMVIASWGRPDDINRTTTAYSISEQWIYGSINTRRYLYFDNNILTTIQN